MKISIWNRPVFATSGLTVWLTLAGAVLSTVFTPLSFGQMGQTQPEITISEIRVEGNVRTDPNLIIVACGLQVGRSYNVTDFHEASARAIKQLWTIGMFTDIQLDGIQVSESEVIIVITVAERPRLNTVSFRGNDKLKRKDLLDAGRIVEGMSFGPSNIAQAVERIRAQYREEGYLQAVVDSKSLPVASDSTAVNLVVTVDEGSKVGISEIVILGNEVLNDRQVRSAMETGTGFLFFSKGKYDRKQIERDHELIALRYAEAGHLDAAVVSDSLSFSENGKEMTLYLTLDEGSLYTLSSLEFSGIELFDMAEVEGVFTVEVGAPYNQATLDESRFALQDMYTEEGYVYADVDYVKSFQGGGTDVAISVIVMEGEPADVAHVYITGNEKTKEHVIRRELLLKPGDRFSRSSFERSIREVMALNYFSNVELEPPPSPTLDGDLDVTIHVTERPTGQAIMGAGYSERDGLIGNIGLQLPNLLGSGQQLDFTWDFGRIRRTIMIGFSEPWLFNTPTLVGVNVYRSELFWNVYYKQRREGLTLRLGRRLRWPDDYFRTSIGYRLEDTEFYDFAGSYNPSPAYDLRQWNWPIRNSSISWTITRDSRDRPEFPTSGSMNSFRLEVAGGPFGGDEQYTKWDLTQSFYFLTWSQVVMALKVRGGLVEGYNGWDRSGFVPFNVKYLPGGTSFDGQIRGYENRRVGPIDRDGLEIGGQSMLIFTLEYTFPLAAQQALYGLVFADAGNSWLDLGDTDPFNLRRSVGFGLRMFTPMVGLIGFDFAYGFDHYENGRRKGRWVPHFQFGAQFY